MIKEGVITNPREIGEKIIYIYIFLNPPSKPSSKIIPKQGIFSST